MCRSNSHSGAWGSLWLFSLLVALAAPPAASQVAAGQVVDAASGQPVGEGFVVLLDEQRREVARALTAADGRFTLRAPQPGRYSLRSERIGYVASVSPPFVLEATGVVTQRLAVEALAVELATVVVTGRTSCRTRPDEDVATAAAWEEVRKALAAAAWIAAHRIYQYRAVKFNRDWNPSRTQVALEVSDTLRGWASAPFASRPAAELAALGYIVADQYGTTYYGPDANVIQDTTFLANHCFGLVRRSRAGARQLGLTFEPEPHRRLPDVKGVLWLDEQTAELRLLEFSYTRIPAGLDDDRIGGTVEFLRLPTGAWIVHRWELRMPRLALASPVPYGGAMQRVVLHGFRDGGGEVLEIRAVDGTLVYQR